MSGKPIRDLIKFSQQFSDGTLTAEGGRQMTDLAQSEMAPAYQIAFPPSETLLPGRSDPPETQLRGLYHELTQHLRDLRYLDEADFLSYHRYKTEILARPAQLLPVLHAVQHYLTEDPAWETLNGWGPSTYNLLWLGRHLPELTKRLSCFTAWDGSMTPPDTFAFSELSPYSRSLEYRLRTLSSTQFPFFDKPGELATNIPTLNDLFSAGFDVAGEAGPHYLPAEFFRHLADIDLLLGRYIDNTPHRKESALLYQLDTDNHGQTPLRDLPRESFTIPRLNDQYYNPAIARRMIHRAGRRGEREDDGLDVRLLQVKLWQTGYYIGAIDGEWGSVSHQALKTFLHDEANAELPSNDKVRPRHLRRAASIRSLLLPANRKNLVYVADFKKIIKLFSERAGGGGLVEGEELANQVEELRREAGVSSRRIDEKVLGEEGVKNLYPNVIQHPARRVAYLIRTGLRKLWGGIKKVFRWLRRKVVSTVEQVLGPVFTFVKRLLQPIRVGVTRFLSGFRYLANFAFGRPIVTVFPPDQGELEATVFVTKFGIDFDGQTIAPRHYRPGQPAVHAQHVAGLNADLFYFIDGITFMIRAIARLGQPGGWVWLGLKLFGVAFGQSTSPPLA